MPHETEVYNLFASCVRQDDPSVTLQGLVPDFMYERTPPKRTLGDVKGICVCPTRYGGANLNEPLGAVNRRADLVTADYRAKAQEADQKYNGTVVGQKGPLEKELLNWGHIDGLVFGAFGEVSKTVEVLMGAISTRAAGLFWREMGAKNRTEARAVLTGRTRRKIGITVVRAHARMKLDRLREVKCGDYRAAARRRRQSREAHRQRREEYYNYHGPNAFAGGRRRQGRGGN